jgi:DNA topoisomerase I
MPDLVIMESATKCKKAQKYLGSGYVCISSKGHVIDLPRKKFGVKIKNDFEPTYETMAEKKSILKEILTLAKDADTVYLMADPDREGEAIAWHLSRSLPKGKKFKRATTNSITKDAILAAIKNAGDLDFDLINAYECRRILDRIVGFKCSYPVKMATGGISVGRTQSAGLRILGERELEIQNFVPEEYFTIEGVLVSEGGEKITVDIKKPKPLDINTSDLADEILSNFLAGPIIVAKYETKQAQTRPSAPFRTSTMQQAASSFLGMSPKRAMGAAQKLYESGSITYHRTDSLNIVPPEMAKIRGYISSNFAVGYQTASVNSYSGKVKNAQEAHEAIRPTDISKKALAGDGTSDQARLYQLIWKRTVASQLTNAKFERRRALFAVANKPTWILGANGSKMLFDGFRKIWNYSKSEDVYLPDLAEGESAGVEKLDKIRKETKPPARYSEASFIKKLEETGIGRPSTFQSIPETLKARDYIVIENRSITTTALGLTVMKFCVEVDFCFIDLSFTAKMEELLDEISNKEKEKLPTLEDFWERLQSDLENCKNKTVENSKTDYPCPKCDGELVKKHSRFGAFYSCSNYSKKTCDYKADVGSEGEPKEKVKKEKKEVILSEYDCPVCKTAKMVKREGRYGVFYGCSSWVKTKCKGILDKDGKVKEPKWKKRGKKKKTTKKTKKKD